MAFAVPAGGTASLQAGGSFVDHLGQLVDVVLWVVVVAVVSLDVRRRRRAGVAEIVASEWFVPMSPGTGRGAWRRTYRETAGSDDDDVWVDV
jgi:hypothetical protein